MEWMFRRFIHIRGRARAARYWKLLIMERNDTWPVFLDHDDLDTIGMLWNGELHAIAVASKNDRTLDFLAVSPDLLREVKRMMRRLRRRRSK
jgi:hypothetical protein